MANIFSSLQLYAQKWVEKSRRSFAPEEIAAVASAVVVASEYGNSVCFHMVGGGMTFIPLSTNSNKGVGESVDLGAAQLLTLERGNESITRVEC